MMKMSLRAPTPIDVSDSESLFHPLDGEDYIGDLNTASSRVAGENSAQRGNLEEQVQAQGEVIRVLSTKFDNLVDLITTLTQNRSPDGAHQAPKDPQVHEVEGIANARPPPL